MLNLDPKVIYIFDRSKLISPSDDVFFPYSLDVTLNDGRSVLIGRFSHGIRSVATFGVARGTGRVLTVGSFCQFNDNCSVHVSREHKNDQLVNYAGTVLGSAFSHFLDTHPGNYLETCGGPVVIGDNVVVSDRAVVLSGTTVGRGCVIGAGAVVTKDCADFGIYAGSPAKRLRTRLSPLQQRQFEALGLMRVRSHCLPSLPTAISMASDADAFPVSAGIECMEREPTILVGAELLPNRKMNITGIRGYRIGNEPIASPKLLENLNSYFAQSQNQTLPQMQWSPDIFYYLGIT